MDVGTSGDLTLAASAFPDSTGWHRKWLLLCAVLVWLFFLRFRLMGWLLSQLLTLTLRWKLPPRLRAHAHIQYVTLRPLELGHIAIHCNQNHWRIVCSRIAVTTFVLEFFRSFVQKKMLILSIEDVYIDVFQLDDELLREFVRLQAATHAKPPSNSNAVPKKINPMGFMRFVDFQVRKLHVQVDAFDTRSRFRCSELKIEIPQVFADQNYLHLSVAASSIVVSSRHLESQAHSSTIPLPLTHRDGTSAKVKESTEGGLSGELTNWSMVLDVRLTDQQVIACNVAGDKDEPAYFYVSTSYVEKLLTKKMELIRQDLFPIPKEFYQRERLPAISKVTDSSCSSSPFSFRVVDLPVTIDLVHRPPGGNQVPLVICTHVSRLEYHKDVGSQTGGVSNGSTGDKSGGVQVSMDWKDLKITDGQAENAQQVVLLSRLQIEMKRDDTGKGSVEGVLETVELALNPRLCDVLHSLVVFPDIVDDYEKATLQLLHEKAATQLGQPTASLKRKIPVTWRLKLEIQSWNLQAWLGSMEGSRRRDLEARGQRTTVQSVLPPKVTGVAVKHLVELAEVTVEIAMPLGGPSDASRRECHMIYFAGVCVSTTKAATAATATNSMEVKLSASSISLNEYARGYCLPDIRQLPGLFFSNLVFQLTEVQVNESLQVGYSISATEADLTSSHRRHKQILDDLGVVANTLDRVRAMLTPPDPPGTEKLPDKPDSKALSITIFASAIRLQLLDIDGVADQIEFNLTETKVAYQKLHTGVKNNATCALLKASWPSASRAVEVLGFRFDQVVDFAASGGLLPEMVETASCIDMSLSQLRLWLEPDRRLLLLFLKLDELINDKEEAAFKPRKTSPQLVNLHCSEVAIDIRDSVRQSISTPAQSIELHQFVVHAKISRAYEITDSMQRYLQVTRRDDSCHARLTDCIQVIGVQGSIQVQSIVVQSAHHLILSAHELQLNFAISDVATSATTAEPRTYESILLPKILLYDASAVAKELRLSMSSEAGAAARVILPVLQQAFDTRDESAISAATTPTGEIPGEWRLRFVGAADFGLEHVAVTLPCEAGIVQEDSVSSVDGPEPSARFVQFHATQLACNSRQFQKLAVEFDSLRVVLTERETDDSDHVSSALRSVGDDNLPLPLLVLPRTKVDAVIHWRAATSLAPTSVQQFAVSFDLVLRGKPASTVTQVPVQDETLVVLNWDYVYPLLVVLLTNDDDPSEDTEKTTASTDLEANPSPPEPSAFQCVGVQWNLSLDLIQLAWWDSMSQDSGILIVANDLLSHGIARVLHDTSAAPDSDPIWVLWETTVYLDLFRAYILREAQAEDDYVTLACGALPFEPMPSSRFFVETTGTSYRETHSLCGDEHTIDHASGPLFGDLGFGIADRLHCEFSRVQYSFCIGTASRLHRLSSSSSDPTGTAAASTNNNGSPPKSPRAWTQSVRAKLARLKRRTTSMDNMLLNDGSRPIQVDSMKLLWTIETRDCAFYMIAVTGDSVEAIVEANREFEQRAQGVPVRPMPEKKDSGSKDRRAVLSQPSTVGSDANKADAARTGRRGSTRESLLDLLHQGKLGKKDSPTLYADSSFPASPRGADGEKSSRFENEEMHLPKAITHKKYTLDVHDAQINMLEENSRSSALIASKHIHLEIGFDETNTTTITTLKLECVTGHVAPVDVDITAGVLWYSYARVSTSSSSSPSPRGSFTSPMLLKQVMDECSLAITYSQVLASGATAVEADMSSLQLSTDRHQFYQLLNVLRHVLLAPPTVIRRIARSTPSRRDNASESTSTLVGEDIAVFPTTPTHSMSAHSTKKLHAQLVEELRHRDSKMLGMYRSAPAVFKHISFRSAGCVFRLRTSPESTGGDHEFVEIRAEGLTGSHMYFLSQSTKFVLNLQWMEINNLRPGPSSIAFEDAMAVLKAKLMIDQRHAGSSRDRQKGMLTVRAESGPQMRVLGQKLRVLDLLEVSIFPEIPNMIVIQLAADFYELVYKFFFEAIHAVEHQEVTHSEHVLFGKKGSTSSLVGPSPAIITVNTGASSSASSSSIPPSPQARIRGFTAPSSPPHPITIRRKSVQTSNSVVSESTLTASTLSSSSVSTAPPSGEPTADEDDSSAEGHELFYFKYVRIGNVRLRINCNGFFVNLNNFDLDLPPYVCQSKLCTWKKLLQKFESHLKWHVTKESASTGLSHFKNKLLKWTPSTSDKKDKHKKEEDSATMNAQVLFGPYSGTH